MSTNGIASQHLGRLPRSPQPCTRGTVKISWANWYPVTEDYDARPFASGPGAWEATLTDARKHLESTAYNVVKIRAVAHEAVPRPINPVLPKSLKEPSLSTASAPASPLPALRTFWKRTSPVTAYHVLLKRDDVTNRAAVRGEALPNWLHTSVMTHWWQDPVVEARLAVDYVYIVFLLLGVYGWEYLQTIGVEYAIVRRRLPLRWPLIPYLIGRIFVLLSFIFLAIALSPASSLGCLPGTLLSAISGTIAIGCCSTNLMIRTWVMWKDSRLVHMLLLLATLGHWTVLILDMANIRAWESDGICVITLVHPSLGATLFVYTMFYDFFVLVLSFIMLSKQPSKSPIKDRLRTQGLLYFVIVALAYIPPTVFSFLGCAILVGITGSCALTASTIASSRAVRSLLVLRIPHSSDAPSQGADHDMVLTTQFVDPIRTSLTYT